MNHEVAAQEAGRTTFVLTCNINGIPPQERARYGQLVEAFRNALQKRRELPDGYAFQMDMKHMSTDHLTEWIELERQCCPFFEFEILRTRQDETVWLHLKGPEGVKEFILDEFGLRLDRCTKERRLVKERRTKCHCRFAISNAFLDTEELEVSKGSRLRAWNVLQRRRSVLSEAANVAIPPPAQKTFDAEGSIFA